ncbi:prevent-host-death protein [Paenibacillus sp. MY03]|uniref:Antitoxin n=1 Tax=Paenibacillus agaridevorans TaxID=171404 RepID=A0A2R5EU37_9BACL|nr:MULTISPECIES: type II toxin-antitoxin system Phd/YefM family antitoxin [Paenibacillus]OUS75603.1 prevent-host-death protein [Paenibacillus sp. MY03]GBG10202.1 prevent-host-death protein [Paenibacillus agaridevorans]
MPHIRPVSDLRNNFAEISKIVHETLEPVFLTKNGHGDMVVMSIEQYENIQYNNEIFAKLKEAEIEANNSDVRFSHDEVFKQLRQRLRKEEKG